MTEQFSLKDKVVVITGATGVLGEAFINTISNAGAAVGVLGRNERIANERVEKIKSNGGKAISLIADVLSQEDLERAKNKIIDAFGKIDGLVNAAGGNMPGAVIQPTDDIFDLDIDALKQVLHLNLIGSILPTQIFGRGIEKTGEGSIVNISSVSAQRALTKVLGYSLAKAAIESYTKWFAVELALRNKGSIRMNAIAPGFFLTEQNKNLLTKEDGSYTERGEKVINQTPFKRFGQPDELCGALIWLLSDASKFVTGTVVHVDGGFTSYSGV